LRQWILFLTAACLCVGSVVAALATREARDYNTRGYTDPMRAEALPYRVPRLGVNAALEQYTPTERREQLARMNNIGVRWVRQELYWDDPALLAADAAEWDVWDDIVAAVDEYEQIELILVLRGVPPGERDERAPNHPYAPPQTPDTFAQFAGQVADRYAASVDTYQVWDEPNLTDAWGGLPPSPAAYAALLEASHTAIDAADPTATILSAALAPTTETGPLNINEWDYLEALYAYGAADTFDGVGAKPYGFGNPPGEREIDLDTLNFSRVVRLREIMEANGDSHKAVWASNWGWNALPADWDGQPSIWGEVDTATQATYTLGALDRAEQEWPWMAAMTLYHWQPAAPADDPVWGFALMDRNDQPTPLYNALKGREATKAAGIGWHAPDTTYATYQGVWTFGERGADIGWLSDSRFAFQFHGTDVGFGCVRTILSVIYMHS